MGRSAPSVYVPTADLEASLARYSAASYATTASSASVLGWAQYRDDLQPPAAPYCAPTLQVGGGCGSSWGPVLRPGNGVGSAWLGWAGLEHGCFSRGWHRLQGWLRAAILPWGPCGRT